jgi:hypothetical protein
VSAPFFAAWLAAALQLGSGAPADAPASLDGGASADAEDVEEVGTPLAPSPDAGAPLAPSPPEDAGPERLVAPPAEPAPVQDELPDFVPEAQPQLPAAGVAPLEQPSAQPTARVGGQLRLYGAVDTAFDSFGGEPLPENVAELRAQASVSADVELSPSVRLRLAPRAFYRAVTQRGGRRAKATWELLPPEAWVDLYGAKVDVRLGYQVVTFGANPLLSPADVLNPRDLRQWLLTAEPEDFKLPHLAARASADVGGWQVTAAWFPLFQPHLYDVYGQDLGLHDVDVSLPQLPDASVEDRLQARILETERPADVPWPGDVGIRATRKVGAATVGASWSWTTEKLPQVTLDPELSAVLVDRAAGRVPSGAALLSLQQRFEAGERLWRGRCEKGHVLAAEASALVGPAQLDVDLGYSPAQTFVNDRFQPVRKQALTAVVGLGQAEDSELFYAVTWLGLAVPGVAADELLVVLEPGTARGAPRWAFATGLLATVGYRALDRRLEVSVRAALETRGFGFAPRVAYQVSDRLTVLVAGELYQGESWSPFGLLGRNDQVIAGMQLSL